MSAKIRVCFVCTGNICRSPTAEAIFLHLIAKAQIADRFAVDSAGTGGWHAGELAHPPTRELALSRGVKIESRARQFVKRDFAAFDYVIAMDESHVEELTKLAPDADARHKIHLFRDFDPESEGGEDVPDPYYRGGYDRVFDICDAAAKGLLAELRKRHAI